MKLVGIACLAASAICTAAAGKESPLSVEYFLGTWRVIAADPAGGDDLSLCYTVAPFLGDKWLVGSGKSDQPGFESKDVWGKDQHSGEIVRSVFDESGTYAVVRSPGWSGKRLVLEGDARSKRGIIKVRETIEQVGPDQFKAVWEAHRQGKWVPYSIETVSRQRPGEICFDRHG